jgi:hypothetical protein
MLLGGSAAPVAGQSTTIRATAETIAIRAPSFTFIVDDVLHRLRDGQSVRLDLELSVLAARGGAVIASTRQSFNLSFDLWEERFAATRLGTPPRSVSHLTARGAEAWCLEHITVARADLGRLPAGAPFWIRLASQVPDQHSVSDSDADEAFTLRRLIDMLSRRAEPDALGKTLEAGPFRLSD